MRDRIAWLRTWVQSEQNRSRYERLCDELAHCAHTSAFALLFTVLFWAIIALLLLLPLMFTPRLTIQKVTEFSWLFELLSVPSVIIGGLAGIFNGLEYLLIHRNISAGAIMLVLGCAAIGIRMFTWGM